MGKKEGDSISAPNGKTMTDTPTPATLTKYITWFKAHERLFIILVGAYLVFHFYGDVLNTYTDHDKRKIASDQAVAIDAHNKSLADSQEHEQLIQQLADLKLQQATLSAQLQASMAQRAKDTNAQKKTNDNSTSSEVAARTADILRVSQQEIVSTTDGSTIAFTASAAHTNVNALEGGAQAEADVTDLNKQLAVCTAVSAKQDETIAQDQKNLTDEKASHAADVALEQGKTKLAVDNGKKKFHKGLKWGAILGFIGGVVTMHYL
jgi:hypothetical protein